MTPNSGRYLVQPDIDGMFKRQIELNHIICDIGDLQNKDPEGFDMNETEIYSI